MLTDPETLEKTEIPTARPSMQVEGTGSTTGYSSIAVTWCGCERGSKTNCSTRSEPGGAETMEAVEPKRLELLKQLELEPWAGQRRDTLLEMLEHSIKRIQPVEQAVKQAAEGNPRSRGCKPSRSRSGDLVGDHSDHG